MRRVALLKRGQRSGGGANDDAVGGLLGGEAVAEIPEEQANNPDLGAATNSPAPQQYEDLAANAGLTTDDVAPAE